MSSYTWKRITDEQGGYYLGSTVPGEIPSVVSIHKTRDGWDASTTHGGKFTTLAQAKQGAEHALAVRKKKAEAAPTKESWKKPATAKTEIYTPEETDWKPASEVMPATSMEDEKLRLHDEFLTKLAAQAEAEREAAAKTARIVGAAREYGATWAEISEVLGLSLAGAHKKYSRKGRPKRETTAGEKPLF